MLGQLVRVALGERNLICQSHIYTTQGFHSVRCLDLERKMVHSWVHGTDWLVNMRRWKRPQKNET